MFDIVYLHVEKQILKIKGNRFDVKMFVVFLGLTFCYNDMFLQAVCEWISTAA